MKDVVLVGISASHPRLARNVRCLLYTWFYSCGSPPCLLLFGALGVLEMSLVQSYPRAPPGKLRQRSQRHKDSDQNQLSHSPFIHLENTQQEARGKRLEHVNIMRLGYKQGQRATLVEPCACNVRMSCLSAVSAFLTAMWSQRTEVEQGSELIQGIWSRLMLDLLEECRARMPGQWL